MAVLRQVLSRHTIPPPTHGLAAAPQHAPAGRALTGKSRVARWPLRKRCTSAFLGDQKRPPPRRRLRPVLNVLRFVRSKGSPGVIPISSSIVAAYHAEPKRV